MTAVDGFTPGGVDNYADILRRTVTRIEHVDGAALVLVSAIARDVDLSSSIKVLRIQNLVEATAQITGELSARSLADPVGHLYGRGDEGQDPQPAAGRLPAHLEDGVTGEVEMVDTAAADEPACHGAPAGFEADCGVPGPHGPHGAEPASVE